MPVEAATALTGNDQTAVLDLIPDVIVRYGFEDLRITYCNAAWAKLVGIDPSLAIGRPLTDFLSEDARAGLHSQLRKLGPDHPVAADPTPRSAVYDGQFWYEWVDRYVDGPGGPEVLALGRDVTARREAELRLAASESRFRDLADHSCDIVWRIVTEPEPHFDYISPSIEHITGYPVDFFQREFANILTIVDDTGRRAVLNTVETDRELVTFDFRLRCADGSELICESRATRLGATVQGITRDVTELRQLQERLTTLASSDPLTGLPNRRGLDDRLDELLGAEPEGHRALAYIDLDDLKVINDSFGHDAGDAVLCAVAERLSGLVDEDDVVARIGGDEFVILYREEPVDADGLTSGIRERLARPVELDGGETITPRASVGVATTRAVGASASRLLAAADRAMYAAKRDRRRRHR